MDTVDFKKLYSKYYQPKTTPSIVELPTLTYITVEGKGDPNEENGEYQQAIGLLYALCYTIKMSKKAKVDLSGYYDYVVAPLEGLWEQEGICGYDKKQKDKFVWTAMIAQPSFVDEDIFIWACKEVERKKHLNTSKAKLQSMQEGKCVTCMHIGSYDEEYKTLEKMSAFIETQDFVFDYGERKHHEIYLSDPRRAKIEKLKTVLRLPIKER